MALSLARDKARAEAARRGNLDALGDLLRTLVDTFNTLSDTELGFVDGVTAGTGLASKALVLDSNGDVAMPDDGVLAFSREALAAAGSTSADAATISDQFCAVTGADGTKGVALPAAATTEGPYIVYNTVLTANLLVYPVDGGDDNINGLAEDAAITIAPGKAGIFVPTSATQWYCPHDAQHGAIITSTDPGTLALTAELHGGRIVYFSDADGTITLPNATGTGTRFEVVLATAATSMSITVTPSTDEEFAGGVNGVDDDADAAYAWKAEDNDDTISLNGTSTGGKIHDWFRFTDIAASTWLVEGFITQSGGSEATPFSAAITS